MRYWLIILCCALGNISARADADTLWKLFSPELRDLERQQRDLQRQLDDLGVPIVGQTAAQFGHQHMRLTAPPTPSRAPWVGIDLKSSQPIDIIALVPAQVDWQSINRPAYGFPVRFRVELSDDPAFKKSVFVVGDFTKEDFPNPGVAPVTIHCDGRVARYVRVTVTKLAEENQQFFYALGEIMVISGNLNVAIGREVSLSARGFQLTPRWWPSYLVDGRTALGPPIKREAKKEDGLYSGPTTNAGPPWMLLDLGREFSLQQVRLHPIHARLGADIPGFSFPTVLHVEASRTADFAEPVALLVSSNYANPGNNPVTIWGENVQARFIKITSLQTNIQNDWRFGLSELEVYSGGTNVARGKSVSYVKPWPSSSYDWPTSLLVDGLTSNGRLLELPQWLESWERRVALQTQLRRLESLEGGLVAQSQRRAAWTGGGFCGSVFVLVGTFMAVSRLRQRRELENLRLRLTRDIHDEIGSNLAGISVLSEVALDATPEAAAQKKDWNEVHTIAQETLSAMREVLWLVDPREETRLDLMKHLQLVAARMLVGKEVRWKAVANELPADWPAESRRQVFLIFKESLTNIIRHSQARNVELSAEVRDRKFCLSITDDGCGFDSEKIERGIGTNSLQIRARALRGTVKIDSAPGRGTTILLEAPLGKVGRLRWWSSQLKNLFQKRHARRLAYRG